MRQAKVLIEWSFTLPDDDRYPKDFEDAVELYMERMARRPLIFLMKDMDVVDIEEVMPWEKTSYI